MEGEYEALQRRTKGQSEEITKLRENKWKAVLEKKGEANERKNNNLINQYEQRITELLSAKNQMEKENNDLLVQFTNMRKEKANQLNDLRRRNCKLVKQLEQQASNSHSSEQGPHDENLKLEDVPINTEHQDTVVNMAQSLDFTHQEPKILAAHLKEDKKPKDFLAMYQKKLNNFFPKKLSNQ